MTLDTLIDALTVDTPQSRIVDEIAHTGGAGISFVERWTVYNNPHRSIRLVGEPGPLPGTVHRDDAVYVWRVMWQPNRKTAPVRIAYGATDKGLEGATVEGRREALRLAKLRRQEAA